MCGITGFTWEDKDLVRAMSNAISHRGPDAHGYFTDKGISLGHRRLSIIDLSPKGKQPMFNEDNTIAITFNGEIYNFKEIKKDLQSKGHHFKSNSDTEVIIHGYEVYGEQICSMLDGMFAFGLWDKKNKKLLLARDRVGKKPLYYSIIKDKLIFASEIKSLFEASVGKALDKEVMLDILANRFSPGNKTIFKKVHKLPPGSYAVFADGDLNISTYWHIPPLTESKKPIVKEVDSLIEKSVEKRLLSDVPVGVLLSGGLDSSTIVSYMSRKTDKIKTFSVGFTEGINESNYARIVADHFSTDHKEIFVGKEMLSSLPKVIWHLDEPIADPAALPTYLLCKEVSKHVKVALSGEGGDEVFGGYHTVNTLPYLNKMGYIPKPIKSGIMAPMLDSLAGLYQYPKKQILHFGADILSSKDVNEAYKKLYYLPFNKEELKSLSSVKYHELLDKFVSKDLYSTSIKFYFKEWLPNDLLMKVDKTSMAHGLEIRAPFLDRHLIEYFFAIPRKYKMNRALFKSTVSPHLPPAIRKRKKQGFSLPLSNWFTQSNFINRISPHITDLANRNIFKQSEINRILSNPSKYRNDHKLWALLTMEIWHKLYIDNTPINKIKI